MGSFFSAIAVSLSVYRVAWLCFVSWQYHNNQEYKYRVTITIIVNGTAYRI